DEAAPRSKDAFRFLESRCQIFGNVQEVMEPTLDDKDVTRAISKGEPSAIGSISTCTTCVLLQEPRGDVDSFERLESEGFERVETIAPSAEQFHDLRIDRPRRGTEVAQPSTKLRPLLGWSLELLVRSLPVLGGWTRPGLRWFRRSAGFHVAIATEL